MRKKNYLYDASTRRLDIAGTLHEEISAVRLGEVTFYVNLKEEAAQQLTLLDGATTPAEVQSLVRYIAFLRKLTPILAVGEEGDEITDQTAIRRVWFDALKDLDKSQAAALEIRLKDRGAKQYLGR